MNNMKLRSAGKNAAEKNSGNRFQEIRKLEELDELLCMFQLFLDDARSRRDMLEAAYFSQEIRAARQEKKKLLALM